MVQFVKTIVEEASLKGFDVLWAKFKDTGRQLAFTVVASIHKGGL